MANNVELEKYIPIVKMIADTFGENCEVVLHDLSTPTTSVIYVANNRVTGRMVGQSFDHLIRNVLLAKDFFEDYRANYEIPTEDGRLIKSSTCLLRNTEQKVIGALCINYELTAYREFEKVLSGILRMDNGQETETEPPQQTESQNITEVLDSLIDSIIQEKGGKISERKDRLEVIRFLNEKGGFLIKGAVEKVADKMNVSPVTVYGYLDEVRKSTS